MVFKVSEQHPSDLENLDMIKVVYGEESIPVLYENARISQVQLPGATRCSLFPITCEIVDVLSIKTSFSWGALNCEYVGQVSVVPCAGICCF